MVFEHVARISVNYDENTSDRQSTCYQTVVRFHIWIKQMFCNSICGGLMENKDESAVVLISAAFVTSEQGDSAKVF